MKAIEASHRSIQASLEVPIMSALNLDASEMTAFRG